MSKRQGISESQVLAGVVAALSFFVTYLGWPVEVALLTFVASILIHSFAWVRRKIQKIAEKNQSLHDDTLLAAKDSQLDALADQVEFLKIQLEKVNISVK